MKRFIMGMVIGAALMLLFIYFGGGKLIVKLSHMIEKLGLLALKLEKLIKGTI